MICATSQDGRTEAVQWVAWRTTMVSVFATLLAVPPVMVKDDTVRGIDLALLVETNQKV